jgi:uncharacterized protein DUF6431
LIAEDVTDRGDHDRRVRESDGYRPECCARCGGSVLHVHDYRERKLRAEPGVPIITIVRHICVRCDAIWQTLPGFIARHLWRTWRVVERALTATTESTSDTPRRWPTIPARTQQRWEARFHGSARFLIQVLAVAGAMTWSAIAVALSGDATCAELIDAYAESTKTKAGERFASLAALVYRLSPKVRLM